MHYFDRLLLDFSLNNDFWFQITLVFLIGLDWFLVLTLPVNPIYELDYLSWTHLLEIWPCLWTFTLCLELLHCSDLHLWDLLLPDFVEEKKKTFNFIWVFVLGSPSASPDRSSASVAYPLQRFDLSALTSLALLLWPLSLPRHFRYSTAARWMFFVIHAILCKL